MIIVDVKNIVLSAGELLTVKQKRSFPQGCSFETSPCKNQCLMACLVNDFSDSAIPKNFNIRTSFPVIDSKSFHIGDLRRLL